MMQRIHIAGLGRSGTTLFRELHRCFKDTWVHNVDSHYDQFIPSSTHKFAVTKNPSELLTWAGWGDRNKCSIPEGVLVPYLIRHPTGLLDSVNRGTIGERLGSEAPSTRLTNAHPGDEDGKGLEKKLIFMMDSGYWEHSQVCIIRYEDLVVCPDDIQKEYAEWAGLEIDILFTQGHERFAGRDEVQQNGYRPIDTRSIYKWENRPHADEIRRIIQRPGYRRYMETYYPDYGEME